MDQDEDAAFARLDVAAPVASPSTDAEEATDELPARPVESDGHATTTFSDHASPRATPGERPVQAKESATTQSEVPPWRAAKDEYRNCQKICNAILGAHSVPESEWEDLFQEIYRAARRDFDPRVCPTILPLVKTICENRAKDWLRSRQRQNLARGDMYAAAIANVAGQQRPTPEHRFTYYELLSYIPQIIPESDYSLILWVVHGIKEREIAEALDITEVAVRKRVSRIRIALRTSWLWTHVKDYFRDLACDTQDFPPGEGHGGDER